VLEPQTKKAKDIKLVAHFTEWYCAAIHQGRTRSALATSGGEAVIYGKKVPMMCAECAEYIRYVEERTEKCPKNPKPFCTTCDIKCYNHDMAEYARTVMRYSGPRSIVSRYWLQAVKHVIARKRQQKAAHK